MLLIMLHHQLHYATLFGNHHVAQSCCTMLLNKLVINLHNMLFYIVSLLKEKKIHEGRTRIEGHARAQRQTKGKR
uniref:Uncharacterized protein n=2 Tax=Picea TaxID=3328 RepID=A0A101M3P5_PICGL|nr:hypothetical protein ABT39_MTgene352 [Picea glauca]QHR90138.1 hypothetical protein Q903MT_gene4161 [Picea sitchensis]